MLDRFAKNDASIDDRFIQFVKKCQEISRDEIRDAFPDYFLRITESIREQNTQTKDHLLEIFE